MVQPGTPGTERSLPFMPRHPSASYRGFELGSAFQPIVSITHSSIVGYEALLRAVDSRGMPFAPDAVFDRARLAGDLLMLDQRSSETHVENFGLQDPGTCWLFLNVHVGALRSVFARGVGQALAAAEIVSSRVVVEVLEHDIADDGAFIELIEECRSRGYLIAIDDFGRGHSNIDRIFDSRPDIVKLDASLVARGRTRESLAVPYRHLVSMLHGVGSMVLAEGIESLEDALFMMATNVDFLQGFWLSTPQAMLAAPDVGPQMEDLWRGYVDSVARVEAERRTWHEPYSNAMQQAAAAYVDSESLDAAADIFLAVPGTTRIFILDERGRYRGPEYLRGRQGPTSEFAKLAPVEPGWGVNLSRRDYFTEALERPGDVFFTGPYYSIVDGPGCYAVSIALRSRDEIAVLCGNAIPPSVGRE